ncbi:MAG: family 43 glycosylhydrolase [Bacteroidales bacterium]|nr:family 43 glycosylhydrolase [Bacteroidales bacterium]
MTNFLDKVRFEKGGSFVTGTNPVITNQFSADPSAHVFNGRLYLYPSHDIPTVNYQRDQPWFCMSDYHVYSTDDLTHWTDHGNIVDQKDVPWGNPTAYSMWAPDCVEKDGKYYFYFPNAPGRGRGFGFGIGVAVSDSPSGPFKIQENTVQGTGGIDPCAFKDDDGTIYLIWSGMGLRGGKLADNMMEIAGESVRLDETFPKGQTEGPFMFKRNGKYYLTYPWVRLDGGTETLCYAMSDNPLGPYVFKGVFMEESPVGCWTNHHSFVEFKGEWYLFYHHNDFSPNFDKNRSVRVDKVSFREDGTIIPVVPTWRGVGYFKASDELNIDRYSECVGAKIDYLDEYNYFAGWKVRFTQLYDRVRFDEVDFGTKAPSKIVFRARSEKGGTLSVSVADFTKTVAIPAAADWTIMEFPALMKVTGMQDITVESVDGNVEVDWISFR